MIDFIGLELIVFHNVPLESIRIQKGLSSKLILEISLWNEERKDYFQNTLTFGKLEYIKPDVISISENSELEICSFDYHLEDGLFYGKITYSAGLEKPSFEIDFSCKTVEIKETKTEHNQP